MSHEHERSGVTHAPSEKPQQIERRLIRPVHVLDHQYRRPCTGELIEHRAEQSLTRAARLEQLAKLPLQTSSEVKQRPQRSRGQHCVARAASDTPHATVTCAERLDQ